MSRSQNLRSNDIRAVYQLLGECRELGADALTWMRHFNESVPRLAGAQLSIFYEIRLATRRPLIVTDRGWGTPSDQEYLKRFIAADGLNASVWKRFMDAALAQQTCVRPQVLSDRQWYGSEIYRDYMKPTGLDSFILVNQPVPMGDSFHCLILQRPRGARPFSSHAQSLTSLCIRELAPLTGTRLAVARDPGLASLSPRLRQVLRYLLEGDSEPQVARRLGISSVTVHQYVKALYRYFRINSRSELLAYFLRRAGMRLAGLTEIGEPQARHTNP